MAEKWIQELKPGAYRKQLQRLGLVEGMEKIDPAISRKIVNTKTGNKVRIKGKTITVTPLLKQRAQTHLTLLSFKKNKKKRKSKKKKR